jgi:KDO2-lipid IV(A) lauroyltransferase
MRCWGIAPLEWAAQGVARLPQRLLLDLGTVLWVLLWPVLGERRRIARINIDLCFPEKPEAWRRRLARTNVRNTVIGALELLRAWYAPSALVRSLARVEGIEHLQAARAAGQGVLLFTGHFTDAELAGRIVGEALGRPVRVVIRRNNHPCVEDAFERARTRVFGPTLAKKDVRGLLRSLQAGEVVAYSADQNFTYQNAFVPFFGVPAATLTSTPEMARRGNARMHPFWFWRDAAGIYHVRIEAPWAGWQEASPEEAAAIYMRELEKFVREKPEQYLWVHRRFKTRPPGEAPIY